MIPQAFAVGGSLLSAAGAIQEGDAAARFGEERAGYMRQAAGEKEAAGQRQAEEERRKEELMLSRLIAVSASSGAGVTDPTVLRIAGGISAEGELARQTAMYNAQSEARALRVQADTTEAEGQARKTASRWRAAGSLLSMGAAFK